MNENNNNPISRRAALGAIAGVTAIGMAQTSCEAKDSGPSFQNLSPILDEYHRLRPLFEQERQKFPESSKTFDYWRGKNGKAIIALGPAIIPLLIAELRKGDFFFNVPLELITNVDIATALDQSEQAKAELWLKWWDAGKVT